MNQTTIVDETCEFQALENIMPGTAAFNDAFGDCYISGFIEGGDFNGIISMRVIDRSKIDTVTAKIKQGMSSGGSSDFNMDIDAFSRAGGSTNIAQDTECTISVSWMGGGQIKDPRVAWDMDSVYASAAAFPALVAKCPQKTYAILTKYKANRSFNKWSRQFEFSPLEYDAIASFTAELFDNYMEYKQLTKLIHDMIANPSNYKEQTWKTNRIPLVISTLSAVKKALGIEMRKIVQAVDVLSKDPGALKRGGSFDIEPADGFVQAILAEAQLDVPWQDSGVAAGTQMVQTAAPAQQPFAEQPAEHIGVQQPQAVPAVQESSATGETAVADNANGASNADTAVATTVADGATADAPTAEPTNNTNGAALGCTPPIVVPAPTPLVLNTISMIAPEIWADKLPLLREDVTPAKATDAVSSIPKSLAALLPPPPAFDAEDLKSRAPPVPTLQILSAVCGVNDVTDAVRKLINTADGTLSIRGSAIKGLLDGRTSLPVPDLQDSIHLTAAYQYVGQPIRIFIAKAETSDGSEDTTRTHQITSTSTEYPTVAPLPFDSDIWSITAVVYGAKLMTDSGLFDKIRSTVKTNYDGGKGARWFPINNSFFGSDPWGAHCKTAVVFYSLVEGGVLQSAVGVEGRTPILLTDRRLPDVPDPLAKKFQPPGVTWSGSLVKPTCSRIYFSGWDALKIDGPGRTEPFLSFDNGVGFFFKPDGNFTVEQGGRTLVSLSSPHIHVKHLRLTKVPFSHSGTAIAETRAVLARTCVSSGRPITSSARTMVKEVGLIPALRLVTPEQQQQQQYLTSVCNGSPH